MIANALMYNTDLDMSQREGRVKSTIFNQMTSCEKRELSNLVQCDLFDLNEDELLKLRIFYLFFLSFSNTKLKISREYMKCMIIQMGIQKLLKPSIYQQFENEQRNREDMRGLQNKGVQVSIDQLQNPDVDWSLKKHQTALTIVYSLLNISTPTYKKIVEISKFKETTIHKYLGDKDLLQSIFSREIYRMIEVKIEQIGLYSKQEREQQKNIHRLRALDEAVYIYLHSRYSMTDPRFKSTQLSKYVSDDLFKRYYGEEIAEQIKQKGKELTLYADSRRFQYTIIRDPELIAIVKPSIIKVTPYQKKILDCVALFLQNYGNIKYILRLKTEYGYNYNYILSSIESEGIRELLKEDTYERLERALALEKELTSPQVSKRKMRVSSMIEGYLLYHGNLFELKKSILCSDDEMMRLLTDELVYKIYGQELFLEIINALEIYKDKKYVLEHLEKAKCKKK